MGIMVQEVTKVTILNLTEWLIRANDPSGNVFAKDCQGENLLIRQ